MKVFRKNHENTEQHARKTVHSLFICARERKSKRSVRGDEVGFASEASNNSSSLPFCAGVQFSRDSVLVFKDRMKYEK